MLTARNLRDYFKQLQHNARDKKNPNRDAFKRNFMPYLLRLKGKHLYMYGKHWKAEIIINPPADGIIKFYYRGELEGEFNSNCMTLVDVERYLAERYLKTVEVNE